MRGSPLGLLMLLVPAIAWGGGFDKPARPLSQVLEEAQRAGKPVLLDFSTIW